MSQLLLQLDSVSHCYHGTTSPAVSEVSLELRAGECVCLTGPSGCGKTTLLLAIRGILEGGSGGGKISITPAADAEAGGCPVGILFQNVESQLLCTTVAEEVAFGPENLCLPPPEIARRVLRSLHDVGLAEQGHRNVERFSLGQKQRLAIAAILAMEPRLLLLDEPTAQLDGPGKMELVELLQDLKRQGYALLIAEHDLEPLRNLVDRWMTMAEGKVVAVDSEMPMWEAPELESAEKPERMFSENIPPVIITTGLQLTYPETGPALRGIELNIFKGERIHLAGRNGSGKSSLLRSLVGMEKPDTGRVTIAGIADPCPGNLTGRVGFLVQNPVRQLFENSVTEEVGFTLRKLSMDNLTMRERIEEALDVCEIGHLAERAPLTLSFGEQHRVALAAILAPRPAALLLDEPFAGLDRQQRLRLLRILSGLRARWRTTVVIASHDHLPDPKWADRQLVLEEGFIAQS